MIQIFRFSQSGASTCHAFSGKLQNDRNYICCRCLQNFRTFRNRSDTSLIAAIDKKTVNARNRSPVTKKRLKETELLKVTKTQTTQTTMTIGKLNASHVAAFVEEPGMILKNVNNSKSISNKKRADLFYGTLGKFKKKIYEVPASDISNIKDINSPLKNMPNILKCSVNEISNSINENGKEVSKNEWQNVTSQKLESQISTKENYFKSSSQGYESAEIDLGNSSVVRAESKELQEEFRKDQSSEKPEDAFLSTMNSHVEAYLNEDQSIHAFVDVCVHCGSVDHAFRLLTKWRKVKNPEVYNTLLRSFSQKGDWIRADILVKHMENLKVPLTPQTFALQLLSVAQGEMSDALERTGLILERLQEDFAVNDLFTKTNLNIQERENVLKQIRKIMPLFDIAPTSMNLNSKCSLVTNLYKDQHPLKSQAPRISREFISKAVEKQLALEDKQICAIKSIVANEKFSTEHRVIWSNLKKKWEKNFLKTLASALEALKREFKVTKSKNYVYPYLLTLPAETFGKLAVEEIEQLVQFSPSYSESTFVLYQRLGEKVYQMYCKRKKTADAEFNEKMKRQIEIYCRWYANPIGPARNARQKWQMLMGDHPDMTFVSSENVKWPSSVEVSVGRFLYNIIFKSALIPERVAKLRTSIPAFYLVLRQKADKLTEEVKIHPILLGILRKANNDTIKFPSYQLPMLCPPKPWSSVECGGYYFLSTDLIRSSCGNVNPSYIKNLPNQVLYAVYDSLNKLQSVPWRINEKVLDVAISVFKKGGSKELDIPVKPDSTPLEKIPSNLNFKEKLKVCKERAEILRMRREQYSLWCDGLYKLSLANHYRKTIFWLPENLDFRGRVYPVPPHVTHVSADPYRSLLLFAKKERLGEKGFDWLKIHVINLTGAHKKKSIQERLDYANQILPEIVDSAEHPLRGRRWWTESEDPWQTLAACFEINEVLKCDDPKVFESGFPIHQDGSCNGLQHYAALGKDTFGATSVNLSPSETPQDVYSDVANLIELERAKDEQAGVEIAKLLKGLVTRKVVKRPVMTTVYGVTWYGAKLQIAGVLTDFPDFPQNLVQPASSYLATKIFQTLRKLFGSAKEIQDWFNLCSDVITRQCGSSVSWQNPMGLPVVQPYYKFSKKDNTMKPDPNKQKNAFAPNFIHSLDSTHMMLTALRCETAGVTFASVHDCFWTHPSSVDVMNKICRESFVDLHSQDILGHLSNHFVRNYVKDENAEISKVFTAIPKLGNFDLTTVKESVYFFA